MILGPPVTPKVINESNFPCIGHLTGGKAQHLPTSLDRFYNFMFYNSSQINKILYNQIFRCASIS